MQNAQAETGKVFLMPNLYKVRQPALDAGDLGSTGEFLLMAKGYVAV